MYKDFSIVKEETGFYSIHVSGNQTQYQGICLLDTAICLISLLSNKRYSEIKDLLNKDEMYKKSLLDKIHTNAVLDSISEDDSRVFILEDKIILADIRMTSLKEDIRSFRMLT